MDVYEAISTRKTIRDFSDKEIPYELIRKLIQAGLKAPSNDHMRNWEFIVIQNKNRQMELEQIIDAPDTIEGSKEIVKQWGINNQIQKEMYIIGISKQHSMILNASCIIIPTFYADYDLLKPKSISSLNCLASIWCCIENILISASSEGIYGVTRIPINEKEEEEAKRLFKIPVNYYIPCYIALGYPHEKARAAKQIEYDSDKKIHMNEW